MFLASVDSSSQGLLNSNAITSIHFDNRQPAYFIATFADATLMQFNLFAEDPIATSIAVVSMPWTVFFDRQRELQTPLPPTVDRTVNEEEGEIYEDSLMLWKNEDWGSGTEGQKGKKNDERSPWAEKNPIMACRVGQKSLTGKYAVQQGEMRNAYCRNCRCCILSRWTNIGHGIR